MGDSQRELEAFRARQYSGPHPAMQNAAAAASAASAAAVAGEAAAAVPPGANGAPSGGAIAPDTARIIIHFDADQFYAQVEEVSDQGAVSRMQPPPSNLPSRLTHLPALLGPHRSRLPLPPSRPALPQVRDSSLRGRPVGVTQKYLVVTCNQAARAQGVTKLMGTAEARRRCPNIALVRCVVDWLCRRVRVRVGGGGWVEGGGGVMVGLGMRQRASDCQHIMPVLPALAAART